jgi:hypothetical protein
MRLMAIALRALGIAAVALFASPALAHGIGFFRRHFFFAPTFAFAGAPYAYDDC